MTCLRAFAALLVVSLVLAPRSGSAQSVFSPCLTNANNNATAVLSSSVSSAVGVSDESFADGANPDSIAAFTSEGTCVGVTAWDASGTTLPIAGSGSRVSGGVDVGDSLYFRIYDASRQVVDKAIAEYTDCSSVSEGLKPLCRDDGQYESDAIYVVNAIGSTTMALQIKGSAGADGTDAGWRFVGLPTASAVPAGDLRIGGEAPNFSLPKGHMLLRWNDTAATKNGPSGAYEALSAGNDLEPGRGYALFLFDEPPYAVDPAIKMSAAGAPELRSSETVTVGNLAQTARWHLLANPYPSGYDLSGLTDLASSGFQTTVQRYDATRGTWVVEDQSSAQLAEWQAFFIERTDFSGGQGATSLTFDPSGRIVDVPFVGSKTKKNLPRRRATLGLALHVTGAEGDTVSQDRAAQIVFDAQASEDWDPYDATKLPPLSSEYALLAPLGSRHGNVVDKAVESRPWLSTLQSIPLRLRVRGLSGERATLSVDHWALPDTWRAQLIDQDTGQTLSLREEATYTFTLPGDSARGASRFELRVVPTGAQLPVELASFQARRGGTTVQLHWETAGETNNAGFRILRAEQRRKNARSWTQIGFVEGSGTTQETRTYRFDDDDLPYTADTLTYRLEHVDTDGTAHVSAPVSVARSAIPEVQLQGSFPNPAHSQTTIQYALPQTTEVRLEVFDVLGRRTMTLAKGEQDAGRREIQLDVSRLASGIYFYRLRTAERSVTRKLTVVH